MTRRVPIKQDEWHFLSQLRSLLRELNIESQEDFSLPYRNIIISHQDVLMAMLKEASDELKPLMVKMCYKVGNNEKCPCGSNIKFKKCCK